MNVATVAINPNERAERYADFNSLQSALQTGNLTTAQHAYAAFEQEVQKAQATGAATLFAPNSQPTKDLQRIGSALKAADLAGAQTAFASLKQDVQNATGSSPAPFLRVHPHLDLGRSAVTGNGVKLPVGSLLNYRA